MDINNDVWSILTIVYLVLLPFVVAGNIPSLISRYSSSKTQYSYWFHFLLVIMLMVAYLAPVVKEVLRVGL